MTAYNPEGRRHPYRLRTTLIITALVISVVWLASWVLSPGTVELPHEVYQPTYPITAPGWLEPTVIPTPGVTLWPTQDVISPPR